MDHLQQVFYQDHVAVLYIYCDYKDQINQTDRSLFASLAKQSILQQSGLSAAVKALYDQCNSRGVWPSSEQSLNLLTSSMVCFRRIFIVLDALDEHFPSKEDGYSPQIPLLSELIRIQKIAAGRCSLFITSREIYSIQEQLHDWTRLDVRAHNEDIASYIKSRICDDDKFAFASQVQASPDLAKEIVEKLVEKAQGM